MILPILGALAIAWWMAAPDPVTAGARTAAGTGVRAAGAGVRDHWAAGRDGRKLTRTARRDRWSKGGGFWRNLLRLEHGAVITTKGVKGVAGITRAAVRPVPAAVRAGWNRGRERHRAKAGNRPVPVALDPPWWRREQPQVQGPEQPAEQVQEQVQPENGHREQVTKVSGIGDVDPATYTATTRRLPGGSIRGELFYTGAPEEGEQLLTTIDRATEDDVRRELADIVAEAQRDAAWGTPARIAWVPLDENGRPPSPYGDLKPERLDAEEQIRGRHAGEPFWNLPSERDAGYTGPLDQDGQRPDPERDIWQDPSPPETEDFWTGEYYADGMARGVRYVTDWTGRKRAMEVILPEIPPDPEDQPAGTSPAGPTTPTPTEGAPVPSPISFELRNHVSVEDFARHIDSLGEHSDFVLIAEKGAVMGDNLRGGGFGREMDTAVDGLGEDARLFAMAVTNLRQAAADWAGMSANVRGA